jgi:hypothetical protein
LPKDGVEEIYRTSVRFSELVETLEVLLDEKTMRRINPGEQQFRRKQYVVAKGPRETRRVLHLSYTVILLREFAKQFLRHHGERDVSSSKNGLAGIHIQ